MGIKIIKESLYLQVEKADERLLRLMYAMSLAYDIPDEEEGFPPSEGLKPINKTDFIKEIKDADEEIENGKLTSLEDLEKEMQQW